MTPNNTVGDLNEILYEHCEDLTDVQHIKLRQALESHYLSLFLNELLGGDELEPPETPDGTVDIVKYYPLVKNPIRNELRRELRAKAKTLLSKEGL